MVDNRGRAVGFASLLLLASSLVLPGTSAQAAEDTLYLSAEVVRTESYADCQDVNFFGMDPQVPEAGRAYAAMQLVRLSCPWAFEHTVGQDATISGDVTIHVTISCEDAYVSPGAEDTLTSFGVDLLHNGEAVGSVRTSDVIDCVVGDAFTFDFTMPGIDRAVTAGDVLQLEVVFLNAFNPPPAPVSGNVYVVTGGDDPSRITLPGLLGGAEAAGDEGLVPAIHFENLTAPAFLHEFTNATSDDYTLNFTVPWQNATIAQTAEVVSGSANVTVLRDGEVFMAFQITNQTAPAAPADDGAADGNATDGNGTRDEAPVLRDVAGNWSVVVDYEGFVGRLGLELADVLVDEPAVDDNGTDELDLDADASEGVPGPALPLLVLGLLAVVAVARRRA